MKIIKAIPSLITSLNLICGSLATFFALKGNVDLAVFLVVAAAFFDFFDGFAARLLKAVSEFGKQLDSLSDLISFGFAPSALLYNHIIENQILPETFAFLVVLIILFSAFRLAKFNIDPEQSVEFKGMPTPATALFLLAVVFPHSWSVIDSREIFLNQYFILAIIVVLPTLMVSNLKLMSLKVKKFSFKENIWQLILIIGSFILLSLFAVQGLAYSIILYLILSLIRQYSDQKIII